MSSFGILTDFLGSRSLKQPRHPMQAGMIIIDGIHSLGPERRKNSRFHKLNSWLPRYGLRPVKETARDLRLIAAGS